MNYINLQHCINKKLLETSKAFNLPVPFLSYDIRLKNLEYFLVDNINLSHLMVRAYKLTMYDIADKVLDKEFDADKFVLYFPYSEFPDAYKSIGRHDVI